MRQLSVHMFLRRAPVGAGDVERDGAIARLSLSADKPITGRRGPKH
ncbi:MAG: hypothetical protein ACK5KL_13520 [Dysgonomonas sp.]